MEKYKPTSVEITKAEELMTDEQKAKAEEAKNNAVEAAKKEGELLAKYQDRAAENYKRNKGIKGGAPPSTKSKKK